MEKKYLDFKQSTLIFPTQETSLTTAQETVGKRRSSLQFMEVGRSRTLFQSLPSVKNREVQKTTSRKFSAIFQMKKTI